MFYGIDRVLASVRSAPAERPDRCHAIRAIALRDPEPEPKPIPAVRVEQHGALVVRQEIDRCRPGAPRKGRVGSGSMVVQLGSSLWGVYQPYPAAGPRPFAE